MHVAIVTVSPVLCNFWLHLLTEKLRNFRYNRCLPMIAITAATLFTPVERLEHPLLLIDDGIVREITTRGERSLPAGTEFINLADAILVPGYIDLHIHGAAGHDVMDSDPDALPDVERLLARHGVTAYLPTTVTAPLDDTLAALDRLANAIELAKKTGPRPGRARPIGIHLEGPFLSHNKRGVHPVESLLRPSVNVFERMWQAARGHVSMMTIAPELEGARELITLATQRGVCVSLGHSDADLAAAHAGVEAGARHATHTFNAMRSLDHRNPGILGCVLADKRLTADIIADGIHVHPSMIQLFLQAKGSGRAVLITDGISATGMPDGRYRLGDFEVEVRNGRCDMNGVLAGSVLTLDRAVRNIMEFAEWPLDEAVRLATQNPAKVLRQEKTRGNIAVGTQADLVALSPAGDVIRTLVGGRSS